LLPHSAAPHVVTGVDENPKCPGHKTRLRAKCADAALDFQKRFLYGVFSVAAASQQIARNAFHTLAMKRVKTFVAAHLARLTSCRQLQVLRMDFARRRRQVACRMLVRFHSCPPLAPRA